MKLSVSEIKDIWRYKDGKLFWKINPKNGVREGEEAGSKNSNGYWQVRYKQVGYSRHRIIYYMHTNNWPDVIDHINQDKTDDRFENLREASPILNSHNCDKAWGKTPYRGVYYRKDRGKFQSTIRINGKQNFIGVFNTAEEASEAYQRFKQIHTTHIL